MTPNLSLIFAAPIDATALAAVWNRTYPDRPTSEHAFSFDKHRYLLAREDDQGVAYLEVSPSQREGDPEGKYWAYLTLSPGSAKAAVMRTLYQGLETLRWLHSIPALVSSRKLPI